MKPDDIALKLRNKEQGEFWRKVANTVNGCAGYSDIAEMWRKHCMGLFNSVNNTAHRNLLVRWPWTEVPLYQQHI